MTDEWKALGRGIAGFTAFGLGLVALLLALAGVDRWTVRALALLALLALLIAVRSR